MSVNIDSLHWLVGGWQGKLGDSTVTEHWNPPANGSMDTAIRVSGPDGVQMLEFAVIREDGDSLIVHLRQFTPVLEMVTNLDMKLNEISAEAVSFAAEASEGVSGLAYTLTGPESMQVDVAFATGDVVTAQLNRV